MQKLSRRQKENIEKIKNTRYSNIEEAIILLKKTATAKFDNSTPIPVLLVSLRCFSLQLIGGGGRDRDRYV